MWQVEDHVLAEEAKNNQAVLYRLSSLLLLDVLFGA